MAKVKNVSGADRVVNDRLVLAGANYEIPDGDDVESYTCQTSVWEAVKPSKAADNDSQEG